MLVSWCALEIQQNPCPPSDLSRKENRLGALRVQISVGRPWTLELIPTRASITSTIAAVLASAAPVSWKWWRAKTTCPPAATLKRFTSPIARLISASAAAQPCLVTSRFAPSLKREWVAVRTALLVPLSRCLAADFG